jgi:mersacidin/lichenicidin family type 2 lantibiotic
MTTNDIVRSWKDEEFRDSLPEDERALLPESPAGLIELSDEELLGIDGGDSIDLCGAVIGSVIGLGSLSVTYTVAWSIQEC